MSLKTFTRAGKKALAIAVSAAMVAAFTPVTALGSEEDPGTEAGTAPSAGASLSEKEAEAVAAGKYFKVAGASDGTAIYCDASELGTIATGSTVTLLQSLTIANASDAITVPAGITLDLNGLSVTGENLGSKAPVAALDGSSVINGVISATNASEGAAVVSDALSITGTVAISSISASSIAGTASSTLSVAGNSTVLGAVKANIEVGEGARLIANAVCGNTLLNSGSILRVSDSEGFSPATSVEGDVTMGASSRLLIAKSSEPQSDSVIGLDGNLSMGEHAESALVSISVTGVTGACAINNSSTITVSSGQTLTAYASRSDSESAPCTVIAGSLSVAEGATVNIRSNSGSENAENYAVGGALNASAGLYYGKIGAGSSVSGGCFKVPPEEYLAEGYGLKYELGENSWAYYVVPRDTLTDHVTNAYWGVPSYITDEAQRSSYPAYTMNFTGGLNSTGTYYIQVYKQQADGTYKNIYTSRYVASRSGARDCSYGMFFHVALQRLGAEEKSGVYKFCVTDWDADSKQKVGEGVFSDAFYYTAPQTTLEKPYDLEWSTENGKYVASFKLPADATGYCIALYHLDTKTNTYKSIGGTFSIGTLATASDEPRVETVDFSRYPIAKEGGFYKFAVQSLSFDLSGTLDSAESDLSPKLDLGDAFDFVIKNVASAADPESGKEVLANAADGVVGTAMIADDDARNTIADAEARYATAKDVSFSVESNVADLNLTAKDVVGATFNAVANTSSEQGTATATSLSLQLDKASTERAVDDPGYESVIQFSMDLVQTDAGSAEPTYIGKDSSLEVPVCITIPVPGNTTNLRIYHYHGSSADPEVIWPIVFEENGKTYARFYVTGFSDFVLAAGSQGTDEEPTGDVVIIPGESSNPSEPSDPGEPNDPSNSGNTGGSNPGGSSGTTPGGSGGTGGSAPAATPHEHVFGEGVVTTPATCTAEGVMTYTCTQPGCSETKTEPIPALGHQFGEWTVTTPATTEAEGVETRTCSVCGEAETRSIAKLEAGEPGSGEATPGDDTGSTSEQESAKAAVGTTVKISGVTYKVTAAGKVKVTKIAASKKTATLPSTIKVDGKTCKVVGILASALKSAKVTKLIIKSKNLTKKGVKNALKGSKVTTVKVSVSTKKATNQTYIAKYAKYFTKANCGKKVTVK